MKSNTKFFVLLGLFVSTAAVAQSPVYLNVSFDESKAHVSVSQDEKNTCASATNCVTRKIAQLDSTAFVLDSILNKDWAAAESGSFTLKTDLDLGQVGVNGDCRINHTPFTFKPESGTLNGGNHTVKNLCYSHKVDYSNGAPTRMKDMGFFGELNGVDVKDLNFETVQFDVQDVGHSQVGREDYKNYKPMGALAARINDSKVANVTLAGIKISGPAVGGVVGASISSTFDNIRSEDRVVLKNSTAMTSSPDYISKGGKFSVFLGGVVGYAVNPNLSDIDIQVELDHKIEGTSAALGGVIGRLAISDAPSGIDIDLDNPLEITNVKVAGTEGSSIWGGRAMGGLIGEIGPYYSDKSASLNVKVSKAFYKGNLEKSTGDTVFVGGMFGRIPHDVANHSYAVSCQNCEAEINLNDDLTDKGQKNWYYAGGVVGFVGCNSNSGLDQVVSFTDSKVSGNIDLYTGENSNVKNAIIDAGGLAGFACLSVGNGSITGNKVSADISVDVKTSDSVMVGGFAGTAGVFLYNADKGLYVQDFAYSGNISVKENAGAGYVSAGVGYFSRGVTGTYIAFKNVDVSDKTTISVNGTVPSGTSGKKSFVGGVCGKCVTSSLVENVSVRADVVTTGFFGDSLFVGGMIGDASISSDVPFVMKNNFHTGKLDVAKSGLANGVKVGYLVGSFTSNKSGVQNMLLSNYHYGLDDWHSFGYFKGGSDYDVDPWNTLTEKNRMCFDGKSQQFCWNMQSNVRNGVKSELDDYGNGLEISTAMMTQNMADRLNKASGSENVWQYDEGKYGGLPYLVNPLAENPEQEDKSSSSSAEALKPSSSGEEKSSSSSVSKPSSSGEETSSSSSVSKPSSSGEAESSSSIPAIPYKVARSKSWNMVSIKGLLSRNVKLGTKDISYWWDENDSFGSYWQYKSFDSADVGEATKGYWLWSDDGVELVPIRDNVVERSFLWKLDSTYSGWNMVANPYGWSIEISKEELLDSLVLLHWTYDSLYQPTYVLKPYEAAWIHVSSAVTLNIKGDKPSAKTLKKNVAMKSLVAASEWSMTMSLSDKRGRVDSWNIIGSNSEEVLTPEPPAGMGDLVNLSIIDGNRNLAKSLKVDAEEMSWTLKLSATTDRDGFLKIDGIDQVNALGKKVYVTIDGKTVEAKSNESLKVALTKSSKTAIVSVTANGKPVIGKSIDNLHLTQLGGSVNVEFSAAKSIAGSNVKVELVSVLGKVATSVKTTAEGGMNVISMQAPERGLYVLNVRVGSQSFGKKVLVQ